MNEEELEDMNACLRARGRANYSTFDPREQCHIDVLVEKGKCRLCGKKLLFYREKDICSKCENKVKIFRR